MKMCQIPAEPDQQSKVIEIIRRKGQRIGINNITESGLGISIEEEEVEAEKIYQELINEVRQLKQPVFHQ